LESFPISDNQEVRCIPDFLKTCSLKSILGLPLGFPSKAAQSSGLSGKVIGKKQGSRH
jgi:hypothetical protein